MALASNKALNRIWSTLNDTGWKGIAAWSGIGFAGGVATNQLDPFTGLMSRKRNERWVRNHSFGERALKKGAFDAALVGGSVGLMGMAFRRMK